MDAKTIPTTIGREAILGASDLKIEFVDVPEWGGTVGVREMSGEMRDRFEGSLRRLRDSGTLDDGSTRARLVAWTVCDESGKLLFTEADVEALSEKSCTALDRVFSVAADINGLSARAKDTAEKNLSTPPSADSTSA